jgi:hypothetical protein
MSPPSPTRLTLYQSTTNRSQVVHGPSPWWRLIRTHTGLTPSRTKRHKQNPTQAPTPKVPNPHPPLLSRVCGGGLTGASAWLARDWRGAPRSQNQTTKLQNLHQSRPSPPPPPSPRLASPPATPSPPGVRAAAEAGARVRSGAGRRGMSSSRRPAGSRVPTTPLTDGGR